MSELAIKYLLPAIGASVVLYVANVLRKAYYKGKENSLNELDLLGKQIQFKDNTQPISNIVDNFNKDLGGGRSDGDPDKKG